MSSKKRIDLKPASFEDLANQVFEKSKQMSMSMKEQCKLVQEYLKARLDGSDGSDAEYNSDFYSDSESESDSDSDSDFEEDSLTDSDEQTDESESEHSEVEERTKPSNTQKSTNGGLCEKQISKVEPEQSRLVAFVAPLKSPAPRIHRRLTMAGGVIAPHSRSSAF